MNGKNKEIKNDIKNFIESFRGQNSDVTTYGSEKVVNKVTPKSTGFSKTKITDRKITSDGVK